ncbi:hypothetical protein AAFC00_004550 [Neodothiora populina]|uniref:NOT2/NOT3/NOT5 C-terminal domain-containing protein n=1 Tax=Neodothiora populina TaxID=2781224 RepID=A0ABR3P2P4_9PEZI
MGAQRLQNGKLGGASSWGFGMPSGMAGGAPGLSNNRPAPLSNFAQAAMGASHSQAPLDLSEFPSLSGGPSQPNNVPQAWNSTAIRQQPAVQRPQPQQASQSRVISGGQQPLSLDSQFDGQSAVAPRGANNQTQSASADFPPLGGQLNLDRRRQAPGLNGLGQMNGQADQSSDGGSSLEALRSPSENFRTPSALQDVQESQSRQSRNVSNPSSTDQHLPFRNANANANANAASLQQTNSTTQPNATPQLQQGGNFETPAQMGDNAPTASQQQASEKQLSEMTESEKYGLPGLMAQLHNNTFFQGQELTGLEIDLDSSEPLHPMWSTPFASLNAQRITPEFLLPAAYSVNNVPPIHTRITAFTDDTLFAIFYQFTRDVLQEVAAGELYARDWRWHKQLRQWMMKDTSLAQPVRVSERSERGFYIFFDANNWRRERREFVLSYDDLDQRHGSAAAAAAAAGGQPVGL